MVKVSVIVAVYNKGEYLEVFFNSILRQTIDNIEIIVVNNASTDNSKNIIEKYSKLDKRIKVITLDKNIGPSGAFLVGQEHVSGEYFTICDSDDFVEDDYLEVLYNLAIDTKADITMCRNDIINKDKITIKKYIGESKLIIEKEDMNNLIAQLLNEKESYGKEYNIPELGAVWIKLYNTKFMKENNLYYEKEYWHYTDFVFNIKVLMNAKKFAYIDQIKYHFVQSENSVTRTNSFNPNKKKQILDVMSRIDSLLNKEYDKDILDAKLYFYYRALSILFNEYRKINNLFKLKKELKILNYELINNNQIKQLLKSYNKMNLNWKDKLYLKLLKYKLFFLIAYKNINYTKKRR